MSLYADLNTGSPNKSGMVPENKLFAKSMRVRRGKAFGTERETGRGPLRKFVSTAKRLRFFKGVMSGRVPIRPHPLRGLSNVTEK